MDLLSWIVPLKVVFWLGEDLAGGDDDAEFVIAIILMAMVILPTLAVD